MSAKSRLQYSVFAVLPLAALAAAACGDASTGDPTSSSDESLIQCSTVVTPDVSKSLFVTDATALAEFPLKAVMDQIVATGSTVAVTKQTSLGLYQQMMDTMNSKATAVTSGPHCDDHADTINGFPIDCPRSEGALAKTNPFGTDANSYSPIGIVNRFDLAPKNGANCGQYRVVYGKNSGKTNAIDRVLFIFEAVLPNPTPAKGLAACTPVAQFWDGLTSDPSAASRASKLHTFYFKGLPGFSPVIKASHYGIGNGTNTGQIRANMFFNPGGPVQWQLREFHLAQTCKADGDSGSVCTLQADNVAVQNNPFGGLFGCSTTSANALAQAALGISEDPALGQAIEVDGGSGSGNGGGGGGSADASAPEDAGPITKDAGEPPPPPPTDAGLPITDGGGSPDGGGGGGTCKNASALAFQKEFLTQVAALSGTNINAISMSTPNGDNAGQSSEQDSTNDYLSIGGNDPALLKSITAALPKGSPLTAQNILDRATTQSCAGCHQVSVGRNLGSGLTWPQSNGFTQIDERSTLSPALTGTFLPFRAGVLKKFLTTQCTTPDASAAAVSGAAEEDDSNTTIGGSVVGAAN